MLRQARAFGVGLILSTQNPSDVDYKGLSNAGTWLIGKLQTEQDKNRLLDGLETASGGASRSVIDKLLSSLGKRVFVMHNVHAKEPILFQTRWTMNFLAGPLTRNRILELNQLANSNVKPVGVVPHTAVALSRGAYKSDVNATKPPVPVGIKEYYLPQNFSLPEAYKAAQKTMPAEAMIEGVVYRPSLVASAQVRVLDRKLGVDSEIIRAALVATLQKRGSVRWDDYAYGGHSLESVETAPVPSARFGTIDSPLNDAKLMTALQKDFADWVLRNSSVKARANTALKVFAGPDVSQAEFMRACADAARDARDKEITKQTTPLDRQLKTLEDKLAREERELREDESELSHRKVEEAGTHLENVTGLFGGKRSVRRLSSSLTKRRQTEQAKSDVEESIEAIALFKQQIADVEKRKADVVAEINNKWGNVVNDITEVTVSPKKTDVFINLFGVAWMPYYSVKAGGVLFELPAFGVQ